MSSTLPVASVPDPAPLPDAAPVPSIGIESPVATAAGGGVGIGTAATAAAFFQDVVQSLDTWSIVKFVLITAILVGVAVVLFTQGNIAEIAANFEKYRCNPLVIPFAGLFGHDAKENFNFCIGNLMTIQASGIFAPVYGLLANFVTILTTISNAMMSIRQLFATFFVKVNGFISSVQDRIVAVLFQLRLTFLKMQTLMGRVYGTMYATMFMGVSAIAAGTSLGDNDLVKFLFEIAPCFEGSTRVLMADGSTRAISDIRVGDEVSAGGGAAAAVTSVFVFDGHRTPLVELDGVRISATHYVAAPRGGWVEAGAHPEARPSPARLDRIFCLNVQGNKFVVMGSSGPLVVADYCESASRDAALSARSMALKALNGVAPSSVGEAADAGGALGVGGEWTVERADGRWVRVDALRISDVLKDSGRIYGIVRESCDRICVSQNGEPPIAAAQLQWRNGSWASEKGGKKTNAVLYSLFTERCSALRIRYGGVERVIRDYLEAPLPEMQAPYEAALTSAPVESPH